MCLRNPFERNVCIQICGYQCELHTYCVIFLTGPPCTTQLAACTTHKLCYLSYRTPLHYAAGSMHYTQIVLSFLQDTPCTTQLAACTTHKLCYLSYRTPLHYAAGSVHYRCVVSLVTAGADINVLDNRGCTPLHYAAASDIDAK